MKKVELVGSGRDFFVKTPSGLKVFMCSEVSEPFFGADPVDNATVTYDTEPFEGWQVRAEKRDPSEGDEEGWDEEEEQWVSEGLRIYRADDPDGEGFLVDYAYTQLRKEMGDEPVVYVRIDQE